MALGVVSGEFRSVPAQVLAQNRCFSCCDVYALEELAAAAFQREGTCGQRIAEQGAPFPYLGVVLDGTIAVTMENAVGAPGVRRVRLYEAHAGATFCEAACLDNSSALGAVSVLSRRAGYLLLPAAALREHFAVEPALLERLAMQCVARTREIARRLLLQSGCTLEPRIAGMLLEFACEGQGLQPADERLQHVTQREIAAAVGCVKEAAARSIKRLEDAGALRRQCGHIRYLDKQLLIAIATPALRWGRFE